MDERHTSPHALQKNIPLAPLTTFDIGGPARYFCEATDTDALAAALVFARERGIRWCILGGGSNVLVNDRGFDGLVIRLRIAHLQACPGGLAAGAGLDLMAAVDFAASHGLAGIESLAGIPGTVGGAVRGNAGAFGAAIGDVVEAVEVIDGETLELRTFTPEECGFDYRSSIFKGDRRLIIVGVRLTLAEDDPAQVRQRADDILQKRGGLLQTEKSAGSFFLNPEGAGLPVVRQFEEERKITCRNCRLPAGWLIERAGLKGHRLGGAMVSERHANYIINVEGATAEDVRGLAARVKERVREMTGADLQEEVSLIGF